MLSSGAPTTHAASPSIQVYVWFIIYELLLEPIVRDYMFSESHKMHFCYTLSAKLSSIHPPATPIHSRLSTLLSVNKILLISTIFTIHQNVSPYYLHISLESFLQQSLNGHITKEACRA